MCGEEENVVLAGCRHQRDRKAPGAQLGSGLSFAEALGSQRAWSGFTSSKGLLFKNWSLHVKVDLTEQETS